MHYFGRKGENFLAEPVNLDRLAAGRRIFLTIGQVPNGEVQSLSPQRAKHHNQWLILIGAWKLLLALLFIALGFGTLRLLHKDLVEVMTRFALDRGFDPESHFINIVLNKVAKINDHRLRQFSAGFFCYAALDILEGVGLILEKAWAEYLTLILTASFLPWEFFEIVRHITWFKVGLAVINLLVVVYLVFHVQASAVRRRTPR